MVKFRYIFLFLLVFSCFTVSAVKSNNPYSYNLLEIKSQISVNASNASVNHSNSTDYWLTDQGPLDNPSDIEHNWLSNLVWSLAGHVMDTFLDMNGYNITEVGAIGFDGGEEITWNSNDYTIDVPTGLGPVNQVGQEDYEIVYNDLGFNASNGDVIYWDNNVNNRPTIGLAYSEDQTISEKTIGFLTMDIADGEEGVVVSRGRVRNINTSNCSIGNTVYLHPDNPGEWTPIRPTGGDFIIILGMICKVGETDGEICVRNSQLLQPDDLTKVTGFPEQNGAIKSNDASFYNANRTFQLAPNSGAGFDSYYVWQLGVKYVFNETQEVTIPDEEGTYYLYFNYGNFTYVKNPNDGIVEDLIRNRVLVSVVYWNADDNEAVIIGDERHGHVMSSDTHAFLHFSQGTTWLSGLALSDIIADGDGNLNASAQFGVDSGVVTDEDLINIMAAVGSTEGLPIFYLDGASANLRRTNRTGFSVTTFDGTDATRLVWNNPDSGGVGVWGLDEVSNTDFVLAHVFGTNSKQDPIISFIGQADYGTITAARAGAITEISSIQTNYPEPELIPLATIIYQTRDSYSNEVKGRIRTTDEGDSYIDWRQTALVPGAAPSAHPNLASLAWVGSGHSGTADTLAGFDGSGIATEYNLSSVGPWTDNGTNVYIETGAGKSVVIPDGDLNVEGNYSHQGSVGFTGDCVNVSYSGGLAVACND